MGGRRSRSRWCDRRSSGRLLLLVLGRLERSHWLRFRLLSLCWLAWGGVSIRGWAKREFTALTIDGRSRLRLLLLMLLMMLLVLLLVLMMLVLLLLMLLMLLLMLLILLLAAWRGWRLMRLVLLWLVRSHRLLVWMAGVWVVRTAELSLVVRRRARRHWRAR